MPRPIFALLLGASVVSATPQTNWIVWTGAPQSYGFSTYNGVNYAKSATGYIDIPGGSRVNVTYSGEVTSWSEFNTGNTDVFSNYSSAYLAPSVGSLPSAGNFIALTGFSGLTSTITFSAPVTNLVMLITSLGGGEDSAYSFNQDVIIVDRGPGAWGQGPVALSRLDSHTVYGFESSGAIQFNGTFSSISWTVPRKEVYSVFTFGVTNTPGTEIPNALWTGPAPSFAVPEPSTYGLVLGGLALVGAVIRRRAKK